MAVETKLAAHDLEAFLSSRRPGRKRSARVTLPAIGEVEPKLRPLRAKVGLALSGDPLGLLTGQKPDRPIEFFRQHTVGDATPERLNQTRAGRSLLAQEEERFKDGRATGLKRKRFKSQIEVWFERGVIDRASFTAAQAFQRDHDVATSAGPALTCGYGQSAGGGQAELLPMELQVEHSLRKQAAVRAVDPALHFVLAWIADNSNADVSAESVAATYWPSLSERTAMERFKALFEYVCLQLSRHYNQRDQHRWITMRASETAVEIERLLAA